MSTPEIHSRPLQELEPDELQFHPAVKKYLAGCLADCQKRLETCAPEDVRNLQGQIEAFRKAIAAPEKVIEQQANKPDTSPDKPFRRSEPFLHRPEINP